MIKLRNKGHFVENKTDYAACLKNATISLLPKYMKLIQYSLLGRTAASIRLNTTFRGLAPSPSSGKTDLPVLLI
jgi:hypothetical protein